MDVPLKNQVRKAGAPLTKSRSPLKSGKQVQVGNLVVIIDSNLPRNVWPKGEIVKVFPGKDSKTRVAKECAAEKIRKDDIET